MRVVVAYLVMATAGMTFWAWAVFEAQAHFIHLAVLAAVTVLAFIAEPPLRRHQKAKRGRS